MPTALIVGATRGLGAALTEQYSAKGYRVIATARSTPPKESSEHVHWVPDIDLTSPDAGASLAKATNALAPIDVVVINAGFFGKESFDEPDWDAEVRMYTTSAIAPVFLVHHLVKEGGVGKGAKVILVSSESGSIGLRHEKEGGGNFGHHASKAAVNMVGKLLSLDLKDKEIAVGIVHVSTRSSIHFSHFFDCDTETAKPAWLHENRNDEGCRLR